VGLCIHNRQCLLVVLPNVEECLLQHQQQASISDGERETESATPTVYGPPSVILAVSLYSSHIPPGAAPVIGHQNSQTATQHWYDIGQYYGKREGRRDCGLPSAIEDQHNAGISHVVRWSHWLYKQVVPMQAAVWINWCRLGLCEETSHIQGDQDLLHHSLLHPSACCCTKTHHLCLGVWARRVVRMWSPRARTEWFAVCGCRIELWWEV